MLKFFYAFYNSISFICLQSVLAQAASVMTSGTKENSDEGKKNLLLTTLQVRVKANYRTEV